MPEYISPETFKIRDKIKILKAHLEEYDLSMEDLDGKHVIIAVPLYDESLRDIKKYDKELFEEQKKHAHSLKDFLLKNTKASVIDIALEATDVHKIIDKVNKVHYLLLLHEFVAIEEDYIITVARNYSYDDSEDLEICILYEK